MSATGTVQTAIGRWRPYPNWSTLYEVRDAGGFNARRSCDAISVGLWPSTGHEIQGFEVKISRSDWLRELSDPSKADSFMRYCDRWWIAVSDADIVRDGELPPKWGLVALGKRGTLKTIVQAPKLSPVAVSHDLIATICKRAVEGTVPKFEVDAVVRARVEAEVAKIEKRSKSSDAFERDRAELRFQTLQTQVKAFADASGVDISKPYHSGYYATPTQLGKAVAYIASGGIERDRKALTALHIEAKYVTDRLAEFLSIESKDG